MAIIRKSLNEILASRGVVDALKLAQTSEQMIAAQKQADGFAQDSATNWVLHEGAKPKRKVAELVH